MTTPKAFKPSYLTTMSHGWCPSNIRMVSETCCYLGAYVSGSTCARPIPFSPTAKPICIDSGASLSVSNGQEDFVTIQPVKDQSLSGISTGLPIAGIGTIKWALMKSSSHYIISFEVQDPTISEHDGILLTRSNFKMIPMAVDAARKFAFKEASTDVEHGCNDIIQDSFLKKKMQIDVAPAQGLFLEMSYFDFYNLRGNIRKLDWLTADAYPGAVV
jgi:hypothetical protein